MNIEDENERLKQHVLDLVSTWFVMGAGFGYLLGVLLLGVGK